MYFKSFKKNIIIIGPYEIRFISKLSFFQFSFSIINKIVLNQKACLINWVLQFYLYQILFTLFSAFHFNVSIKL